MKNQRRLVYADEVEYLVNGLDSLPWEEDVQTLVNSLSTADVVEVKHGHWIDRYTDIVCSECGAEYSDEIVFMNKDFACSDLNFCPNCGACMNEES
jgi:hypothetical protein